MATGMRNNDVSRLRVAIGNSRTSHQNFRSHASHTPNVNKNMLGRSYRDRLLLTTCRVYVATTAIKMAGYMSQPRLPLAVVFQYRFRASRPLPMMDRKPSTATG